uniref:Carboxylesterase type B domain-containing protein n=1 Tax=Daphnia galeata TaxID=27404 RepID=A0A8J2WIT1_9CRUS|nr:unnamed protein product [Daphnia galeata]
MMSQECIRPFVYRTNGTRFDPGHTMAVKRSGRNSLLAITKCPELCLEWGSHPGWQGVHGDELMMMFTNKDSPIIKHPNDIKVSNTLIDLWTSFATNGVPKSNLILGDWLPVTEGQTRYLRINFDKSQLINDSMPFESNLAFWNQLLDSSPKRIEL